MEALSYCQLMERMLAAEARVVELAAENVGMKTVSVKLFNMGYRRGHETTVESCYVDIHWSDIGEYHDDIVAEIIEDETPATDRILAVTEARGVEKFALSRRELAKETTSKIMPLALEAEAQRADDFAKQLREGADKC